MRLLIHYASVPWIEDAVRATASGFLFAIEAENMWFWGRKKRLIDYASCAG